MTGRWDLHVVANQASAPAGTASSSPSSTGVSESFPRVDFLDRHLDLVTDVENVLNGVDALATDELL